MSVPRPVPAPPRRIRCARFDSSKSGLFTVEREREMMLAAEEDAEQWLAEHPEADVVSISTSLGKMTAMVTIWYRA
jgi:hypothetical protein